MKKLALLAAALLIAGCGTSTTPEPSVSVSITQTAPVAIPATTEAQPVPVETTSDPEADPVPPAEQPVAEPEKPVETTEPEPEVTTPEPVQEAPSTYGCDAAIAYLRANAHPAFTIVCPGYAYGGQAVTCLNHAPQCPNSAIIIINVPCPTAYMNEAANSWTVYNNSGAAIDPYGPNC